MQPEMQEFLDQRFELARNFLSAGGREILDDMDKVFSPAIWAHLDQLALLRTQDKLVIPQKPPLDPVLREQMAWVWSLGYAVGASGFIPDSATK